MRRAILTLAFCQVIWSLGGVMLRWSPLPALTLVPLALTSAGCCLALASGRRRLRLPSWRLRAEAFGFGLANGSCNALIGVAVGLAGVGNAAFAYASVPLWMVLVARPLVGDRVPARALPALGVGAVGIALLLAGGRGSDAGERVTLGLTLALLAAIVGALSALGARRLVPRIGVEPLAAWTMLTGGLILAPFVEWDAFLDLAWWMLPLTAGWIGMHFIFAPVLYNRTAPHAPAFVLAAATFVNTALAPLWGALIFGERLALLSVAGVLLALGANALLLVILRAGADERPAAPVEAPALAT